MKSLMGKVNNVIPFKNKLNSVLFFLCIAPFVNYISINLYHYYCGGYIECVYDVMNLFNPFNTPNSFCTLLSTLMTSNTYIVLYIHYIILLYIINKIIN